jgi:cytochrome c
MRGNIMTIKGFRYTMLAVAAIGALCSPVARASETAGASGVDAVAAKRVALKQSCLRCHGVTKKKEGPTYASVAQKYRGDAEAETKIFNHLTSGETAKLTDGHEEPHRDIRALKPEQVRNLVRWILSQ